MKLLFAINSFMVLLVIMPYYHYVGSMPVTWQIHVPQVKIDVKHIKNKHNKYYNV